MVEKPGENWDDEPLESGGDESAPVQPEFCWGPETIGASWRGHYTESEGKWIVAELFRNSPELPLASITSDEMYYLISEARSDYRDDPLEAKKLLTDQITAAIEAAGCSLNVLSGSVDEVAAGLLARYLWGVFSYAEEIQLACEGSEWVNDTAVSGYVIDDNHIQLPPDPVEQERIRKNLAANERLYEVTQPGYYVTKALKNLRFFKDFGGATEQITALRDRAIKEIAAGFNNLGEDNRLLDPIRNFC